MCINYTMRYIKGNKIGSLFVAGISFLSAMLLSLSCGVFYNMWVDKVNREILKKDISAMATEPGVLVYAFILIAISISLILMIYHAFEVSMKGKIQQIGTLIGIGATPKQIRSFLIQEVLIVSGIPIIAGILFGIVGCYSFMQLIIYVTSSVRKYDVIFEYHFLVALFTFAIAFITILISAWIPARKISKLTPLEAIHYGEEPVTKKMKKFRILSLLFGTEGKIVRKSIYSRRKVLRTTTLSLMFSFLGLTTFLNLECISGISTKHTYFERFNDKWNIRVTMLENDEGRAVNDIRNIENVKNCIYYEKVKATALIKKDDFSNEFLKNYDSILKNNVEKQSDGDFLFNVPIYVLDEKSFAEYCMENRIDISEKAVAINKIWDSVNSRYTEREYLPLLKSEPIKIVINNEQGEYSEIVITGFAEELPNFREEFKQFSLSLVMSGKAYETFQNSFPYKESYYNIQTLSEEDEPKVKSYLENVFEENNKVAIEGKLETKKADADMRKGLKIVLTALAGLLVCIGIANLFSAVMGQIFQRKKEFARYLSIGLSPKSLKKMLLIETLFIGLKPIILSIIINIPIVIWALNSTGISIKEFIVNAPVLTITLFTIFVMFFEGIIYYIGGKKIINQNITDLLKK